MALAVNIHEKKEVAMKIAVIGANGRIGRLLVREAIGRGHKTLAVVRRRPEQVDTRARILVKDLFDLDYKDLKGWRVVIDAYGVWEKSELQGHVTSLRHLADILSGRQERLLVVGSAGSLYVDKSHSARLLESPDMPPEYRPLSTAMTAAFDELSLRRDVNWTYMSPPALFEPDAPRTGRYKLGADELLAAEDGASAISYADAAIALIDEAERANFLKRRFTVCRV
jgi:putative NADH-flavin reductase